MARIALIGANGKVGAEVTMLLKAAGCDIVPISRGPKGSAQLRYRGIPVRHGSIADLNQARGLIGDADVVVNFALPTGAPAQNRNQNAAILENCFIAAPGAKVVFCSTLVALPGFVAEGAPKQMGQYGREKRANTALVERLGRKHGGPALIVRLGHVAGVQQPISAVMRALIAQGAVSLPYPERAANIIHTQTIADMIRRAAEEDWWDGGLRDLVDNPNASWRSAFECEAALTGTALRIETGGGAAVAAPGRAPLLRRAAGRVAQAPQLRLLAERALTKLPERFNRSARIQHLIAQSASEVAAVTAPPPAPTDAFTYPAIAPDWPRGLRPSCEILADRRYTLPDDGFGPKWPADMPPAAPR